MRISKVIVLFLIGFGAAIAIYFLAHGFRYKKSQWMKEAKTEYLRGERGKTVFDRQEAFNSALKSYLELEKQISSPFGKGKVYYNIGNSYYQLGEYPMAVYYYYRAKLLLPREEGIRQNLDLALKKLNLPSARSENVFFIHTMLSLPEKLTLFGFSLLILTFLFSIHLWIPNSKLFYATVIVGFFTAVLCLSLLYSRFIAPTEGVIVKAASLYRDAGMQYAKVAERPIQPGIKVEVLDQRDQGRWIKIYSPEGIPGFVKQSSIRLIDLD